MKRLYLILALTIGLTQSMSAINVVDSLEQTYSNLPLDEKIERYNNYLSLQSAEENAFYHELINQLNNSFQAKTIQTRYSKTFTLIYSVLIIVLVGLLNFITTSTLRIIQLYRIEKVNRERTQELLAQTEDINTVKAQFLQDISYKIRTPLNSVMGLSEVLANNPELIDAEDVKLVAETIQDNSQKLQQLVNAVLDLSRLESGMMKYNLSDYSLSQICQDAISITRMHGEFSAPEIPFDNNIGTASDIIHTDVSRLTQILSEMLTTSNRQTSDEQSESKSRTHLTLEICQENSTNLRVTVKNSPMTLDAEEDSLNSIRQKIAQLFIEHFGGTFGIQTEDIVFTYPLK